MREYLTFKNISYVGPKNREKSKYCALLCENLDIKS